MDIEARKQEVIQSIVTRTEGAVSAQELADEFDKIFKKVKEKEGESFTEEELVEYALQLLMLRYISKRPATEVEIIPVGFGMPRVTKRGVEMATLYVLAKQRNKVNLTRIVFQGEQVILLKRVQLFSKYKTYFGTFRGGDLIATPQTNFDEPEPTPLNFSNVLKHLHLDVIDVSQAPYNPTRVGSDGYPISTDWRAVRGVISRKNNGRRDDGSEWYVFTLTDLNTLMQEPTVTPDGTVITPGLTVWVNQYFYDRHNEYDEVIACGTILTKSRTSDVESVYMNGYLIVPLHFPPEDWR